MPYAQIINNDAVTVLHPSSNTVLKIGMMYNTEPAVHVEGKGGFRLNDNIAVLQDGYEVLSSALPQDVGWL